jgi:hypothetical protein
VSEETQLPRYRFGPLERRGLIGGWRGGQVGAVAVAAVLAVGVLRRAPSLVGALAALVLVAGAVAAVTWPIGGRTAEEWAPDAVRHACGELRRRARSRGSLFATLEVLTVDGGDDRLCAIVHDHAARTYSAVLPVDGDGFVLLGAAGQADRVAAWSGVLAGLCQRGGSGRRLQWVARALPAGGVERRPATISNRAPGRGSAAQRSYEALLQAELARSCRHEVLLVVTVDAPRVRPHGARSRAAHVDGCSAAVREATWLRAQLTDAGFRPGALLDPRQLHAAVRAAFDPDPSPPVQGAATWPWPMATDIRWGAARIDGTWHATYWVAQWPRRDVEASFLAPLLVSDMRRTLAVVMQPVGPGEAARHTEQARTAGIADAELRRRGGFLDTARRRRQEETLVRREDELSEGHAQYRYSGYVTVSAGDETELEDRCARTEQAAALAGLELRRCYGDQGRAFTCTLPLGRGLA